ncbi:hypothetical protein R1sor_023693 [Riccia sorocarpa]|uniref:Uncharacterized protein n=1 Tax=Riccia sorocarpa TaxID=122646 RepID=A0ABD3GRD8_9MARC
MVVHCEYTVWLGVWTLDSGLWAAGGTRPFPFGGLLQRRGYCESYPVDIQHSLSVSGQCSVHDSTVATRLFHPTPEESHLMRARDERSTRRQFKARAPEASNLKEVNFLASASSITGFESP